MAVAAEARMKLGIGIFPGQRNLEVMARRASCR
jgi:hypothetical protein